MFSEKLLLKALISLRDLFQDLSGTSATDDYKEALLSGHQQCKSVIADVESGDISSASAKWEALMYYADDSIGISEQFSKRYQPLRQKIINSGLQ